MADSIERKTFDFLAPLTGVVVLLYVGSAIYAMVTGMVDWTAFANVVGGPAMMLLGYWVRGAQ
jgi:hypothetical protein